MAVAVFHQGDWIFHQYHGMGKIMEEEKRVLNDKEMIYLRVETLTSEYWLPLEDGIPDHIRPIVSDTQIAQAMHALSSQPAKMPEKYRIRNTLIKEMSLDISMMSRMTLLRDLHALNLTKPLSGTERQTYDQLLTMITNELTIAQHKEPEEVLESLENAMQAGLTQSGLATAE